MLQEKIGCWSYSGHKKEAATLSGLGKGGFGCGRWVGGGCSYNIKMIMMEAVGYGGGG